MSIFLEAEGIKGNVTADGYKDHIAILSCQFGVSRNISMEAGKMANREATRPNISEITLTKLADNSATAIFKEAVIGSGGRTYKIKFVRTGADKLQEFMTYELQNCLVSGYSISADSENDPVENITLSFSKVLINYNDHDATNKSGSPQRVGYDLELAKPL